MYSLELIKVNTATVGSGGEQLRDDLNCVTWSKAPDTIQEYSKLCFFFIIFFFFLLQDMAQLQG